MKRSAAGAIKPIDKAAVHRICSGQVVLDLATAVKELIENSLDAGATSIEVGPPSDREGRMATPRGSHHPPRTHAQVRLRQYGSELVEVADNGHGVPPENYQALTLKYHTSKLSEFSDLQVRVGPQMPVASRAPRDRCGGEPACPPVPQGLATFGFRGEALSSLCAVADLSVATRTAEQEAGVRLAYDHSGTITGLAAAARAVGTTVAVRDLFKSLPVRWVGACVQHSAQGASTRFMSPKGTRPCGTLPTSAWRTIRAPHAAHPPAALPPTPPNHTRVRCAHTTHTHYPHTHFASRHKEFHRGLKREYSKLVALLQAYALVATRVRLLATHQTEAGGRTTVVSTTAATTIRCKQGAVPRPACASRRPSYPHSIAILPT
jgi:hypothetical protein